MTVITQDGAPVADMPTCQSDAIIGRMKTSFKVIGTNVDQIHADAVRLYEGRAWIAQGFDSWEEMIVATFPGDRLALEIARDVQRRHRKRV